MNAHISVILGVDPGLQHTGWGIIHLEGNRLRFINAGVIHPSRTMTLAQRLRHLYDALTEVIHLYQPHLMAIEETFVNNNAQSSLLLGHARGALIVCAALAELPVYEYAATLVKKTVVGVGRAEKHQVEMMVKQLLPGCTANQPDACDALAVAICHTSHHRKGTH